MSIETLLGKEWELFRKHRPVGAYMPIGQLDGDCYICHTSWPCPVVLAVLATEHDALAVKYDALVSAIQERADDHDDWCCAKGCAGPGFCGGCDDVCKCFALEFATLLDRTPTKETT